MNTQKKGINLASKCACCFKPKTESVDHVFVASDIAKEVWIEMEHRMQIHSVSTCLQLELNDWWLAPSRSPCHRAMLSLIPTCICWELWVQRNKGRFENQRQSATHVVSNIAANM